MGGRRVALGSIAALTAVVVSGGAFAQPKDPPQDPKEVGDIELEPEQPGSGSDADSASTSGSGSASAAPGAPSAVTSPAAPVKDPKIAKKWLLAGQQLLQKASYLAARNRPDDAKAQLENAVIAYQKAISAGTDVNVYADLATVEDKLGKLGEAVKHFRIIVNTKTGVRPDVARKAATRLEELLAKVGLVTLTVTPAGSSITLGGAELGTSPLPEPLVLLPGTYTLSFQADGFQPKEAEIKIEPGSETERAIELEPVKVIVEPLKPVQALQDDKPRSPPALPLYVGAGVTGAGVLGASIFGILAVSQHSKFTAAATSKLDREDARTSGQRFALITDLSLGTAVVAAGFTAYWYFTKYKQHPRKQEDRYPPGDVTGAVFRPTGKVAGGDTPRDFIKTKTDVVPWVQSQSGGVMLVGSF